ncbi:MAG: hypothetical protein V3V99_13990 [candidate division Zixibacteria bacterium]
MQKIILILALIVLIIMILFPPFYAGKKPFSEGIHDGNMGYYPIWNPPSLEDGYIYLYECGLVKDTISNLSMPHKQAGGQTVFQGYVVGFNKVKFTFGVIILLVITSILLLIYRKKEKLQANKI